MFSKIKEDEGKIGEAADILQELQVFFLKKKISTFFRFLFII